MMRAIRQDVFGGPEMLKEVEIEQPEPSASEGLVGVHAAGLNPTDWKNRMRSVGIGSPPFVLGGDVSGVVERAARGVTIFKPGDEVFGMLPYPRGSGAHAEYVTGPARVFARKPGNIDHIQVAALPLAGLTAWQSLVNTADVQPGQRVLIHAAAGGVGHLAVQIAKARGAYVIGTASERSHDLLRRLGADELIDYRMTDFETAVKDVDVVLDAVSGDYPARSLSVLRPGGLLVSLLPFSDTVPAEAERLGVRVENLLVEADHAGMLALANLVAERKLTPVVAGVFPLSDAAQAHRIGESGHVAGKLVLKVVP
jgi:NADPH:quinone reductase-like Zn-dependent oxidoreductase